MAPSAHETVSEQTAYLNGEFIPLMEAKISTQDRGFLFGDGVYEVIPVYQKKLFYFEEHYQRLENSLQATQIANPLTKKEWQNLLQQLIERHPWDNQYIYLQVTRGIQMQRDHLPEDCMTPTIYAYTSPLKALSEEILKYGIKVVTVEDIRWLRCDIKAITLLPNVMLKLAAKQQGADDAILIGQDGLVREGSASNIMLIKDRQIITPPNSNKILPGITRIVIHHLAKVQQIPFMEREIREDELESADELWLCSSTKEALPICQLNGMAVGDGIPGPLWRLMRNLYQEYKQAL